MKIFEDGATRVITAALQFIFIGHPHRTSLGVLLGLALNAIVKLFSPALSRASSWIDATKVGWLEYIFAGVLIMHFPTLRFYLARKGNMFDEHIEQAFAVIREAEKAGVSKERIRMMRLKVCQKVLENSDLKPATREEIRSTLD